MGRRLPNRGARRQRFLSALAIGSSVAQACAHADVAWTTVYSWRRKEPRFRKAWDTALREGSAAMAARLDSEVMQRAVVGIDEPVLYQGEVVGHRKRYSDRLLMFGIRDLRLRQEAQAPHPPDAEPKVTVVVRQLGFPADTGPAARKGEDE